MKPKCQNQTYKPSAVANYFLKKSFEEDVNITPMKLIKLVYIAHGWHLALLNRPLINEDVEAWRHGPVIRSLYDEFKRFNSNPIDTYAREIDDSENRLYKPEVPLHDKYANLILEKVWDIYKVFTAGQLRKMTHEKDSPWSKYFEGDYSNNKICNDEISEHYQILIKEMLNYNESSTT